MLNLDNKLVWILVIIGFLLPVFTNVLTSIPSSITSGNAETWIGFFGSYFGSIVGGIMGALIAFGIAKFQIDQQRKTERNQLFVQQLPVLIKIKMELDGIKSNLLNAKAIYLDGNTPIPIDVTAPMKLPEVNIFEINELGKILDPHVQANLIKLKYFHADFVEILAFDTYKNDIEIDKLNSEKVRLEKKQKRTNAENIRFREIMEELKELHTVRNVTLSNKQNYLDEIGNSIRLTNELIEKIETIYKAAVKLSTENSLLKF